MDRFEFVKRINDRLGGYNPVKRVCVMLVAVTLLVASIGAVFSFCTYTFLKEAKSDETNCTKQVEISTKT